MCVAIEERFAYPAFRPGQRELAQRVYEACLDGGVLIAEAMLMDEAASSLAALLRTLEEPLAEHGGWLLDRASVLDRFRDDHDAAWLQNLAFELSASSGAAWGSVVYERKLPSLILRVGEVVSPGTTVNPSAVFARPLGLAPECIRTYDAAAEPLVVVRTVVDTGTSTRYKTKTSTEGPWGRSWWCWPSRLRPR